ncbi:MAG: hypothetical protein IBX56_19870 [Methylomicrobium sp.]|nr:hypothetical protein [Methylomicrobium sp.]
MNVYPVNQSVALSVQINGPALSASYRVFDESDRIVIDTTPVVGFSENDTTVNIVVEAQFNQIQQSGERSIRRVEITPYDANGAIEISVVEYVIESRPALITGVNSYQTLNQAKLTAMNMPHLDVWVGAADRDIVSAMTEAYFRLGQFRFTMRDDDDLDPSLAVIEDVRQMTIDNLLALPSDFILALRKAQVSEADIVLGGGSIHRRREDGLMLDTVGESKVMFRPGKPVILPVDRRTLAYLSGYIYHGLSIARI